MPKYKTYKRYTPKVTVPRKFTSTSSGNANRGKTYKSPTRTDTTTYDPSRWTSQESEGVTKRLPYFNPYRQNRTTPAEQIMANNVNAKLSQPEWAMTPQWRSSRNFNVNPITGDVAPTTLPTATNRPFYTQGRWGGPQQLNPYNLSTNTPSSYGQVESYVINPLFQQPPADAIDIISIGGGLYRVVVKPGQSPVGAEQVEQAYNFVPSSPFSLPASWTGQEYLNPYPSLTHNTYAEATGIQSTGRKLWSGKQGNEEGFGPPETSDVLPEAPPVEYPAPVEYPWGGGGGGGGGSSYYSPYTTYQKGYTARAVEPNTRPAFRTPGTAASNYYNNPQTTYRASWQQLLTSWRI